MQLALESIWFNHDPTGKTTGAFNLRRNATQTLPSPEWSAGSVGEMSAVAYAMSETPTPIIIKVKFTCEDPPSTRIWIRALDGTKSELPTDLRPRNVLGEVKPQHVKFTGGRTDYEIFELQDTKIIEAGCSISETIFEWQYSLDGEKWIKLRVTRHRIYTVSRLPTSPWEPRSPNSASIHIPWTDVLDYSCHWAAGHADLFRAASSITKAVNALGNELVTFQPEGSYTNEYEFDCAAFVQLLKTKQGLATFNCDDCATIVSTFSNILGCDLSQSSMGYDFFTNRILPIGESSWRHTSFVHHCVAWDGACLEDNIIFDASLQIDSDSRPGSPPQKPQQPIMVRFGDSHELSYAFALAKNRDCRPIPQDRTYGRRRRSFGRVRHGEIEIEDQALLNLLKQVYEFEAWPTNNRSTIKATITDLYDYLTNHSLFYGWRVDSPELSENERKTRILRVRLKPSDALRDSEMILLNVFECAPFRDPSDFLLQLLGKFQERLARLRAPSIGDIAFVGRGEGTLVFRWGRLVFSIVSAGRTNVPLVENAHLVKQHLTRSAQKTPDENVALPVAVKQTTLQVHSCNERRTSMGTLDSLRDVWSHWRVTQQRAGSPPDFEYLGTIDLTGMDYLGNLPEGDYLKDPHQNPSRISAQGSSVLGITTVKIFAPNGSGGTAARWEGALVYEDSRSNRIIAGTKFVPIYAANGPTILSQNEEPWVITKP